MDQWSRGSNLGASVAGMLRCGDCWRDSAGGRSAAHQPRSATRAPAGRAQSRIGSASAGAGLEHGCSSHTVAHGPEARDASAPDGLSCCLAGVYPGSSDAIAFVAWLQSGVWECGPELAAAVQEQCIQEIAAVVAPKLLGGHASRTPLGDLGLIDLNQAKRLAREQTIQLGDDLLQIALLT